MTKLNVLYTDQDATPMQVAVDLMADIEDGKVASVAVAIFDTDGRVITNISYMKNIDLYFLGGRLKDRAVRDQD